MRSLPNREFFQQCQPSYPIEYPEQISNDTLKSATLYQIHLCHTLPSFWNICIMATTVIHKIRTFNPGTVKVIPALLFGHSHLHLSGFHNDSEPSPFRNGRCSLNPLKSFNAIPNHFPPPRRLSIPNPENDLLSASSLPSPYVDWKQAFRWIFSLPTFTWHFLRLYFTALE
jgi:hypothetical protein